MNKESRDNSFRCSWCDDSLIGVAFWKCSGCQLAYYCNRDCQKQDWEFAHKLKCKKDSKTDFSDNVGFSDSNRKKEDVPFEGAYVLEPKPLMFQPFANFVPFPMMYPQFNTSNCDFDGSAYQRVLPFSVFRDRTNTQGRQKSQNSTSCIAL